METMCLKTGIVPSISIGGSLDTRDTRATASTVSAVGREKPSQKSLFSRFSFRYPLESLWPQRRNRTFSGLSLDDAVLEDNRETTKTTVRDDGEDGGEGQRENWVLKILHVKNVWKGEQGNHEREGTIVENDENNGDDDQVCDTCAVDNDDDEKIDDFEFDRNSFSKMLRRVSLAEARLYAQMSHLGSLAYSIPNIKVISFEIFVLIFFYFYLCFLVFKFWIIRKS